MSAPRRPGDDRRPGTRPAKPPRAAAKTSGADGGVRKKAKPGAIRSFHRAAALKEKAAQEAPAASPKAAGPKAAPSRPERPKADRPKTDRVKADRPAKAAPRAERPQASPQPGAQAKRHTENRPQRERPAEERAERPARASARPAPVRGPGAGARTERSGAFSARRDAERGDDGAPRTPRPVRPEGKPSTKRPEREKPGARVRRDGTVATRRGAGRIAEPPAPTHAKHEPQRIAKLLARAGVASRRDIERMIEEGRVALNGTVLDTPATILNTLQGVTVDGEPVQVTGATRLFLFHKPTGFLTAERDPRGRPTIYDRLPEGLPRVMPIGRLDLNTEGLLLLTNDGEFKRKLELPSSGIPRIYRARAYGEISQEQLETLIHGVTIDGMHYGPIDANMERRTGRNVWIEIKITEGKNREVRRVLEYMGLQVSRLIRVAYGPFVLADLAPGGVVEVRQNDLVEFRKTMR